MSASTRGALKTVDITAFFPTIKMLAINEADGLVYFWDLTSWVLSEGGTLEPKIISATTYTLLASDVNNVYTNVSGCEVTVPQGLPLSHNSFHTSIEASDVTFVADGGVVINNYAGHNASNGQYAVATLFQTSQDSFILGGNTKTV